MPEFRSSVRGKIQAGSRVEERREKARNQDSAHSLSLWRKIIQFR